MNTEVDSATLRAAASPPLNCTEIMPPNFFICFLASSCPGWEGSPGYSTASTSGRCSSHSATACALSLCRSIRTPRVLRPRVVRNASIGPEMAPTANCTKPIFSASSASLTMMAPPTTSECPPMYLVVECTTTSAPRASGFCRYGEAKVLSTTRRAPASCASVARAAMSVIFIIGFDGVSTHTRRVLPPFDPPAATAFATASRLDMSTGVLPMPHSPSTRLISR